MDYSVTYVEQIQPRITGDHDYRRLDSGVFTGDVVDGGSRVKVGCPPEPYTYEYTAVIVPDNLTRFQRAASEFDSAVEQAIARVVRGVVQRVRSQDVLEVYELEVYVVDTGGGVYEVQLVGEP